LAKTFVYGTFIWPRKKKDMKDALPSPPGSSADYYAIEILREFSTTEFIGKLYTKWSGSWTPLSPSQLEFLPWHRWYLGLRMPAAELHFRMDAGGIWKVLNLRKESDPNGPYVAVALEQSKKPPGWVDKV